MFLVNEAPLTINKLGVNFNTFHLNLWTTRPNTSVKYSMTSSCPKRQRNVFWWASRWWKMCGAWWKAASGSKIRRNQKSLSYHYRTLSYHFLKGVPENSIFSKGQTLLFSKLDGKIKSWHLYIWLLAFRQSRCKHGASRHAFKTRDNERATVVQTCEVFETSQVCQAGLRFSKHTVFKTIHHTSLDICLSIIFAR